VKFYKDLSTRETSECFEAFLEHNKKEDRVVDPTRLMEWAKTATLKERMGLVRAVEVMMNGPYTVEDMNVEPPCKIDSPESCVQQACESQECPHSCERGCSVTEACS
jgi:hypothetical protein